MILHHILDEVFSARSHIFPIFQPESVFYSSDCRTWARRPTRSTVDRSRALNYRIVAKSFVDGSEMAREFEYWNAAGVLIIHAAIALTDAITIKLGAVKSRGEDHHEAIDLVESLVADSPEKKQALNHLRKMIDHKIRVRINVWLVVNSGSRWSDFGKISL